MWLVPAPPAWPLVGILEPPCGGSVPLQRSLSWGSWSSRVVGPCPSSAASLGDPGAPVWLVSASPARPLLGILEPPRGWSLLLQCSLRWAPPHVLCTHCPLFCADSSSSVSPGLCTHCFFPASRSWFFVIQVFSNVSPLTTVF